MFYRVMIIFMFFLSLNSLANELQNIKSFEGNFQQTIINSSDKKIVYEGKVFIKNQEKILWQYKTPVVKNVYVIKNIAIIDEPELEQVIYTQLKEDMNLIELIKSAKKSTNNTFVAQLKNIDYELKLNDKKLSQVNYTDELENRVTILFNQVQQNHTLTDELFQFFPPDYYDIIRQ